LIRQFLYPKFGPGQMWEEVAKIIREMGGEVHLGHEVVGLTYNKNRISGVRLKSEDSNTVVTKNADYVISTMPVQDLIKSLGDDIPESVRRVAEGLTYRDFITVGLLLKRLKVKNTSGIKTVNDLIPDNWIYVQEADVKLGRIQLFNNWSPYMVKDKDTVWIGLEYFCNQGDELWTMPDTELINLATGELGKIGFADADDVVDSVVIRMPKTYPAYFGTYQDFHIIREFVDDFENLFLVGRNGMHRYNNQDHSMLTAMTAVDNIKNGIATKHNLWEINTETEYHEE